MVAWVAVARVARGDVRVSRRVAPAMKVTSQRRMAAPSRLGQYSPGRRRKKKASHAMSWAATSVASGEVVRMCRRAWST
jgi:hypothetical protein